MTIIKPNKTILKGNSMLKFKIINPYYITLIFIFIIIFTSTRIYSKDIHSSNKHLKDMIIKLIQEHDKIRAYINNVKSTQSNVDQKDAMYKPSLDLFGDLGKEEV